MNQPSTHPADIMRRMDKIVEDLESLQQEDHRFYGIWSEMKNLDEHMRQTMAKRRADARLRTRSMHQVSNSTIESK